MNTVQPIQQQPAGQVVITTQPKVNSLHQPQNRWVNGLCGCCSDPGACIYACCCTPCFMCSVAGRFGESCCYQWFCCCHFLAVARPTFRAKHNIEGNLCNDALATCCCPFLALCQVDREMNVYNYSR